MHGKMISNDRSEHLPRPPWRYSLQRRWQAPRASRSRPQRRRSRPGKIVGVRFRVRTNFDHGLHSATACGTSRRSSPKAARPSTRSTCGSMIATTDAGPVNPRRTSSRNGAPSTRHREYSRRPRSSRKPIQPSTHGPRAGASLRSHPDRRQPRRCDQTAPNQHCARSVCPTCPARWFPPWSPSTAMTATAARAWPATTTSYHGTNGFSAPS